VDLKEIGITKKCKAKNLWTNERFSPINEIVKVELRPHECNLLKIK
jgi:hypothetical protein